MNEAQLNAIVEQVVLRLTNQGGTAKSPSRGPALIGKRPGVFDDLDSAVDAAAKAQQQWSATTLDTRAVVIEAMRQVTRDHVEELARDSKLALARRLVARCASMLDGGRIHAG